MVQLQNLCLYICLPDLNAVTGDHGDKCISVKRCDSLFTDKTENTDKAETSDSSAKKSADKTETSDSADTTKSETKTKTEK